MEKKKVMIGLAGIVIIAGGFFLFSGKKAGGRMVLETEKVGRTSITNVVTATGTVEPVTEVDVGTQVSGIIDKLYVDYNDVVSWIKASRSTNISRRIMHVAKCCSRRS